MVRLPLSFELVQYNLDISMIGMFSYFDNISLYLPTETHTCVSLCSFCVGEKRIESRSCVNILIFFQKFQGRRLVRSRMIIFKVHFFYSFELQLLDVNEIRKMLATYCWKCLKWVSWVFSSILKFSVSINSFILLWMIAFHSKKKKKKKCS